MNQGVLVQAAGGGREGYRDMSLFVAGVLLFGLVKVVGTFTSGGTESTSSCGYCRSFSAPRAIGQAADHGVDEHIPEPRKQNHVPGEGGRHPENVGQVVQQQQPGHRGECGRPNRTDCITDLVERDSRVPCMSRSSSARAVCARVERPFRFESTAERNSGSASSQLRDREDLRPFLASGRGGLQGGEAAHGLLHLGPKHD
jgi:hypothetical protein